MKRALWLLLASSLMAGTSSGQVPNNKGPEFCMVLSVNPAMGTVTFLNARVVYETVAREVGEKVVNGKVVAVKKVVYETVPVMVPEIEIWSSKKDRAYDGEGVALPLEKVMQLKKGDGVIITRNQKLERPFQEMLNKKAVVFLIVDQK